MEFNARTHLSLLEACRHDNPGVKRVFAGTRQIHGRHEYLPVDKRHALRPVDVNGIIKMADEWYQIFPEDRKRIDIGDYLGACGQIQRELAWEPSVDLREGLSRTLAYCRQHLDHHL